MYRDIRQHTEKILHYEIELLIEGRGVSPAHLEEKNRRHLTPKTRKGIIDMITEFLNYQQTNKGLSNESIKGYEKELRAFLRYARPLGLRWSTITAADIDNYVISETTRGMKPRTVQKRVEVLRLLFAWACHRGMLTENPAQYTQTPKKAQDLPKAANKEQVEKFLSKEPTSREMLIVHAIVAMIYETGARIGEVAKLRGEDIDTNDQSIRLHGKGAYERIVYYGDRFKAYANMMSLRKGVIFDMSEVAMRYAMYKYLPGIHPHAIRHLFACNLVNAGMDLKTLGVLMGHKYVQTTEIYARMSNAHIRALYNQYQK